MSLPDRVSPPLLSPDSDATNDSEENYANCPDDFIQPMVGREREKLEKFIGSNWEETIMKATDGDLSSLQALSASTKQALHAGASNVFKAFLAHLRKIAPRDNKPSMDITPAEQLAMVAIHGLGSVLRDSTDTCPVARVQSSWSSITSWLTFFRNKFIERDVSGSYLLASSIAFLLLEATKLEGLKKQVWSNVEILKLLAFLWSDDHYGIDGEGFVSRAISQCNGPPAVREMLTTQILRCSHLIPFVVTEKLLRRIERASGYSLNSTNWVALDAYSRFLLFFSAAPPQPPAKIQVNFIVDDAFADFIRLMSNNFVSAFPHPEDVCYRSACSAVTQFLTFIVYALEQPFAGTLVPTMVSCGFVNMLHEFTPLLGEESFKANLGDTMVKLLTETLPRFVGTYSLLDVFKMYALPLCSKEAREAMVANTFASEWSLFIGFLLERLAYKALFDSDVDKDLTRCGNEDCQKADLDNSFKACSACKSEKYCSKDCQITAWKHQGHKQICKDREGKCDAFELYCIRRDVIRHLPGLEKLAECKFAGMDARLLGVHIDNTRLPIKFEIYRLRTLLDQVAKHEPSVERRLVRLIEGAAPREAQSDSEEDSDELEETEQLPSAEKVEQQCTVAVEQIFVRVIVPTKNSITKTLNIEVSLQTAADFALDGSEEASCDYANLRPTGIHASGKSLEVERFDKADQYISERLLVELE